MCKNSHFGNYDTLLFDMHLSLVNVVLLPENKYFPLVNMAFNDHGIYNFCIKKIFHLIVSREVLDFSSPILPYL